MAEAIRHDEWLAELERLSPRSGPAGGFSVVEACAATGTGDDMIRRRLKVAIAAGVVEFAGHRTERAIDGRACKVPVYRLVKPAKKGKR